MLTGRSSVLNGLRHGFWPGYEGDADTLNRLSPGPPPTRQDDDDLDLIAKQLNKDVDLVSSRSRSRRSSRAWSSRPPLSFEPLGGSPEQ